MAVPTAGTPEYTWWLAGANDEAHARRDGRSADGLQVLDLVDGLAEHHHEMDSAEIAATTAWIILTGQPLRTRLKLALRLLKG